MADKDWLGADLIFDLDGDHLPGVTDKHGLCGTISWNHILGLMKNICRSHFQVTEVFTYIIVILNSSTSIPRLEESW